MPSKFSALSVSVVQPNLRAVNSIEGFTIARDLLSPSLFAQLILFGHLIYSLA